MSAHSAINTQNAPAAIGPYVQACRAGDFIYLSGQIPLHPETMDVVSSDVAEQTLQVLQNMQAVVAAAGGTLADVVKTTCFLTDMADFDTFNQIYSRYFSENPPARSCVAVSALPKNARVEIEGILYLPED